MARGTFVVNVHTGELTTFNWSSDGFRNALCIGYRVTGDEFFFFFRKTSQRRRIHGVLIYVSESVEEQPCLHFRTSMTRHVVV